MSLKVPFLFQVREAAARALSGMMKGAETTFAIPFRQKMIDEASSLLKWDKAKRYFIRSFPFLCERY